MYTIYADGELLYNPILAGEGYAVAEASVSVDIGGAGMAQITLPPTNPRYNDIKKMRTMISFYQDGAEIFRGRVLHDSKDFMRMKHLSIEGELAFLIDNIMPPHDMTTTAADFFRHVIDVYNSQVEPAKVLVVGTVGIQETHRFHNIEYTSIQDTIYDEIMGDLGGYLRIRVEGGVRYIDLLREYTTVCSQKIRFGENLLDIEDYISAEDTYTVIIPLGAMQRDTDGNPTGRVNIKTAAYPYEYVTDLTAAALYGNIWKTVIFENITDITRLKQLGEAYLSEHKAAINTISVKAIDLYNAGYDADKIQIGDRVQVESVPHGIDGLFQCVRIETDLLDPGRSSYTLGNPEKTLTEMQTASERSLSGGVETVSGDLASGILEAKQYAKGLMIESTNGLSSDASGLYDAGAIPAAYMDIIDDVTGKQYRTTSGGAYRIGITAQDLTAAMAAAGITSPAIVSTSTDGKQIVNYDQLVGLMWDLIKDLRARVEALEGA